VSRPEAREQALSAIYAADQQDADAPDVAGLSGRATALAEGVWLERTHLDEALDAASTRWRVERMPPVDRNVLRLALYELRHRPDTPVAVVINEAVALAKEYSTEKSGAFVNGVLSRLAKEERAEESSSAGEVARGAGTAEL
jgi:N utilization substance protein B